jgi:hypothetical protein
VQEIEVEAKCDRCGVLEADADMAWLCPVVIEVNKGEEGGRRDEYDYCNDCLIEMADALMAAGSRAFLVTGSVLTCPRLPVEEGTTDGG